MVIGVTDPMRNQAALQNYTGWVERSVHDAELVVLSAARRNAHDLDRCRGLLLTGGGDVHPGFYQQADALHLVKEVNEARDEFEFGLIRRALECALPLLGICRGAQVFNVALGGSLIPDIEQAGYPTHRKGESGARLHRVSVSAGSVLRSVVGLEGGDVNTSHHQAVEKTGKGLRAVAHSDDGIVEALEWDSPAGRSFLLLVQWHPERMTESHSPFSDTIIERFAKELRQP